MWGKKRTPAPESASAPATKVVHDEQYNKDIAAAEIAAQSLRHGNALGRVLWGLVEGTTTGLGILDDILLKVENIHDSPPVNLTAVTDAISSETRDIVTIMDAISEEMRDSVSSISGRMEAVENRQQEIITAIQGQNNLLVRILAFTQISEPLGPVLTGSIFLNGKASTLTGENTMADIIKDNEAPATLSVVWSDAKGAPADGVTDAWSGDNDAAGVVADNGDGTATFSPGLPGVVNVTVIGTNADGTTVTLTDAILVTSSDATAGSITLTHAVV